MGNESHNGQPVQPGGSVGTAAAHSCGEADQALACCTRPGMFDATDRTRARSWHEMFSSTPQAPENLEFINYEPAAFASHDFSVSKENDMSAISNAGFTPIFNPQAPRTKVSERAATDDNPQTFQVALIQVAPVQFSVTPLEPVQLQGVTVSGQLTPINAAQASMQIGSSNTTGQTVRYSWLAFGEEQDLFA